ncbi:MAG: Hsp20/alpha crystallin family protein [Phycisphaerae bacterium]|jgi:HSP20 family protein
MFVRRGNSIYPTRLRNELDRVFGDFFENLSSGDPLGVMGRRAFPAINLWEDDTTLYAEAELPGLTMDDLEIYVLGDELTVKGSRQAPETEEVTYHRRERGVGPFSRVLRLPVPVNADKVKATFRDGVLSISLPKERAAVPRRIEVKG